jgi:Uma2 family endonuclease
MKGVGDKVFVPFVPLSFLDHPSLSHDNRRHERIAPVTATRERNAPSCVRNRSHSIYMPHAILESGTRSLADVLHDLGDVPPARIRFPTGNATEDDVLRLLDGDEKRICELIDGVLVEKTVGVRESMIAALIAHYLQEFVLAHELGLVFSTDGPFRLRPGRVRFPDTGFVSWDQFPDGKLPSDAIFDVAPDLAVEVISDGNTCREMERKLRDYFAAGVRLVWYIYPITKTALAYTSRTRKKEIAATGALDGGKVLPGFSLPLAKIFAPLNRRKKS